MDATKRRLAYLDKDGIMVEKFAYSGLNEGNNNPEFEAVHNVGPIPRGEWIISGPPFDHPLHGPYVLRLYPAKGTETFGRDGFLIHGDSKVHPGQASQGCIIVPRETRTRVYQSGDTQLFVTSQGEPEREES